MGVSGAHDETGFRRAFSARYPFVACLALGSSRVAAQDAIFGAQTTDEAVDSAPATSEAGSEAASDAARGREQSESQRPLPEQAPSDGVSPLRPGELRVALDVTPEVGPQPGLGTLPAPEVTGGVPWSVAIGTQTFGQYEVVFPSGADWNHRFALPRMWLYLGFRVENATGRVLVEGTRAIDDGALSGIADDSLLIRVREAWGGYRIADLVEVRAGLVPTLITPWLTQHWGLRALARIGLREFELIAPADLGAAVFVDLPERFGRIGVSYTNGEGYSSRELNRGKNLELAADVHPLAFVPELRPLSLVVAYTNGSLGAGAARSDRVVGGLVWDQQELGLGASASFLLGVAERGEREAWLLDAWARGLLFEHVILGAQFLHLVRDAGTGGDALSSLLFAAGALVVPHLRVYLAVDGRFADALARVASPGWERWGVRVVVEADAVARFFGAL